LYELKIILFFKCKIKEVGELTDDEKLLANIKKRSRKDLEKLIDIYTPYVSVIVYNTLGHAMTREDAEEAVSDTFVSIWKNAEAIDNSKGGIRAYIGAVARNCAAKKLRKAIIHEELNENIIADNSSVTDRIEEAEEHKMLLELIHGLGEPDSEIFLRHYWYNQSASKISEATGICKSTITTKLCRGRMKLKEILRRYDNE